MIDLLESAFSDVRIIQQRATEALSLLRAECRDDLVNGVGLATWQPATNLSNPAIAARIHLHIPHLHLYQRRIPGGFFHCRAGRGNILCTKD